MEALDWDVLTKEEEAKIDLLIKPLVIYLRSQGFRTFASCQGGKGHIGELPWVRMLPSQGRSGDQTCYWLSWVMSESSFGKKGFTTSVHYEYGDLDRVLITHVFVELQLWGI